jgi:hypothetical protein
MAANRQTPSTPIGSLLEDLDRLSRALASVRALQIRSVEVRGHMKAVAGAWFRTYRTAASSHEVSSIDEGFKKLLEAAEKLPLTKRIRKLLKALRKEIVSLQTAVIASTGNQQPGDPPPSFDAVPDPQMRLILARRWDECLACLQGGAPIAATVMMGGMLESLFLARVNREPNQATVFTAQAAPRDHRTQNPKGLREWGLNDYIAVAHELGWISRAANDVSSVLREYRNYVHPHKELTRPAGLSTQDARMFWVVTKELAQRLL